MNSIICTVVTFFTVDPAISRINIFRYMAGNTMSTTAAGVIVQAGTGVITLNSNSCNALNRRIAMTTITVTTRLEGIKVWFCRIGMFVAAQATRGIVAGWGNRVFVELGLRMAHLAQTGVYAVRIRCSRYTGRVFKADQLPVDDVPDHIII